MAKYLIKASYTTEGVRGLLKSGGTSRKRAVEKMIKGLGGKLEAFYYAFGDHDLFAICALPDAASAAACVLSINASGLVTVSATALLEPEDIDKAKDISVAYTAPGK